jgi:hypothetical protein
VARARKSVLEAVRRSLRFFLRAIVRVFGTNRERPVILGKIGPMIWKGYILLMSFSVHRSKPYLENRII